MKALRNIFTCMLLAIAGNVFADNLQPANVEVAQGERTTVSVSLDNPSTNYIMIEFWLTLPQGVSIPVDEDGYLMAEGNSERFKRTHVLEVSNQGGNYHFLIYSSRNEAFNGTSGELFHFTVEAAANAVPGNYMAKISKQLYNDTDKNEYTPEDVTFGINITGTVPPTPSGNLSVENQEIGQGESKVISVALDNPDTEFIMTEFWLTLPQGVTIPTDEEGYLMAEGNAERFKMSHMLEVSRKGDNYHFLIYSSKNEAFNGTSGELLRFTVNVAADAEPGNYTAKISHQLYNDINKNEYTPEDVTFGINITGTVTPTPSGKLSVEDVALQQGERKVVSVALDNPDTEFIMLEFWLTLPQGVVIPTDEDGYLMAEGNSDRFKRTHVLEVAEQEGKYHFLIYSSRNEAFKGTSGELFNFTIEAAANVVPGNYTAKISNQLFNDINKEEYRPENVTFGINITEAWSEPASGNLSVEDQEIAQGERKVVSVALDNPDTEFIMLEFWMTLPQGVTIPVDEDGYLMAEGNSERFKRTHVLEVAEQEGKYHFLIYSSRNEAFKGTSGELFNFTIEAAEDAQLGNYTARIFNQLFNDINKNEYKPEDVSFGIQIDEIDAVSITTKNMDENAEQRYYNLQGIPVTTPKHGVYIHNGKKVVVK